jgi:hypothetical protein
VLSELRFLRPHPHVTQNDHNTEPESLQPTALCSSLPGFRSYYPSCSFLSGDITTTNHSYLRLLLRPRRHVTQNDHNTEPESLQPAALYSTLPGFRSYYSSCSSLSGDITTTNYSYLRLYSSQCDTSTISHVHSTDTAPQHSRPLKLPKEGDRSCLE